MVQNPLAQPKAPNFRETTQPSKPAPDGPIPGARRPHNLRRLFDTAVPRSPEQTSEAYAANLSQALRTEIDTPHGARAFLEGTYPTQAMRSVCDQVMDRLCNGRASNRQGVYAFESGFGGGKTNCVTT